MIFKDYYKILGLETNRITPEQLRTAFREQAKKYHPDVNGGNIKTEERFKDINEAYRVLSNSSSKRKYDRMCNNNFVKKKNKVAYEESKRGKEALFSDFFNMFFGTNKEVEQEEPKVKKKLAIKGENVDTEISVGIEDAYFGIEKKISLRTVNRKNENIFCKNSIRY